LINLKLKVFFAGALLLLGSCSKAPQPAQFVEDGKPAIWRVSGPEGTAWIFGTVHLLPPDTDWQTPVMDHAMREADMLVLEASGLDDEDAIAQIFAHTGISAGQPPLASRIDPALLPQLDQLDQNIPGPRAVLDQMETWAAGLMLASAMSADLGLSQGAGVERVLTLRFRAESKPVSGLETISQQFGYFDSLPEADQRQMLDAILRGAKGNRTTYEKLLKAWMKGDPDGVLQDERDGILASPVVREALLNGRNRKWAKQIGAMIDDGQQPFIAVGAAHVAGKGGVPALLKSAGYGIERIQ
jgi:uncharacterized protein